MADRPLHLTKLELMWEDTTVTLDPLRGVATYEWSRFGDGVERTDQLDPEECAVITTWWREGRVEELRELCRDIFPVIDLPTDRTFIGMALREMEVYGESVAENGSASGGDARIATIDVYYDQSGVLTDVTVIHNGRQWSVVCDLSTLQAMRTFGEILSLERTFETEAELSLSADVSVPQSEADVTSSSLPPL